MRRLSHLLGVVLLGVVMVSGVVVVAADDLVDPDSADGFF